ncbi:MAG: S-adenosylmethionine:tRNA ribosyltransferase-isomerase, partial [Muribaculaceae bacterium]|nr:S-adenosylmethionine:tRNA ribosyltransferase-isomerase [Muribaculaceae bacterium]
MTDNVRDIRIEDYDYPLPDGRIALHPLAERDRCRLLTWRAGAGIEDKVFCELPGLLPERSVLVYNNTRVINARLRFRKGETDEGALIEVFCLEPVAPADYAQNFASTHRCSWTCLVGNSKKWKPELALTRHLTVEGREIVLTARRGSASSPTTVTFEWNDESLTFSDIIGAAGEIPIPPYLNRRSEESDNNDYQTVFSRIEGSVAAPTAGLHFTPALLDEIDRVGVTRREVTLHVGAG